MVGVSGVIRLNYNYIDYLIDFSYSSKIPFGIMVFQYDFHQKRKVVILESI